MKRRMRFSKTKRSPPPAKSILMVTFILFLLVTVFSFWFIDQKIKPTLMEVAERKINEFATRAINSAVKFAEEYTFEDIANTSTDNEGNITMVGWNPSVINKINRASTDRVEEFFHSMNRGEPPNYKDPADEPEIYGDTVDELVDRDPTVIEIPIGQAFGNSILANLGPKIPVNLELVGSVQTDIISEKEFSGINNVMVSLYIIVEADVQIVIPFTTDVTTVTTKILIDKHLVMGKVPDFYSNGGSDGPSIAVPKKDLQDN